MKKLMLSLGLLGSALLTAGTVQEIKNLDDFTMINGSKSAVTKQADGSFKVLCKKSRVILVAKSKIKFDANKKYQFSVKVRKLANAPDKCRFWGGVRQYTKTGQAIESEAINFSANKYATLAKAVKVGDRQIELKGAVDWPIQKKFECIAFNAKKDLSDVPNLTFSPRIKNFQKRGDILVATLRSPMKQAYPAGTLVRDHRSGGTYLYFGSDIPKAEWKEYKGTFKGSSGKAGRVSGKFWTGTDTISVMFITGWFPQLEFRDLKMVEL